MRLRRTVNKEAFRYRCIHCRTINHKSSGMEHALNCPYKNPEVKRDGQPEWYTCPEGIRYER